MPVFRISLSQTDIWSIGTLYHPIIAQAQTYYGYNSYEPDYVMNNDMRSYGNDNDYYESQYSSSSKPDYKPAYQSYDGKDDKRDKSQKDSSKSVSINKIKYINTNLNVNGNNTGDVNVGNKGQGYVGSYSSGDGYDNKKDKGFECIINNNNNNINIVTGGGNATDGNVTDACVECFVQVRNTTELNRLDIALENGINVTIGTTQIEINSLEELCDVLENITGGQLLVSVVGEILRAASITLTSAEFFELITCIGTALDITIPPTIGPIRQ